MCYAKGFRLTINVIHPSGTILNQSKIGIDNLAFIIGSYANPKGRANAFFSSPRPEEKKLSFAVCSLKGGKRLCVGKLLLMLEQRKQGKELLG